MIQMKKTALAHFTILCSLSMILSITLGFNIHPVKADWTWTETIYIKADGSIEPDTAPISTVDSITYTLTDNIVGGIPEDTSAIVVERENIMINGAGFTVQGTGSGNGIELSMLGHSNVTLKNIEVTNFYMGILLVYSHNNTLTGNTATNNTFGIHLFSSSFNNLTDNIASSNALRGFFLDYFSHHNVLSGNVVSSNGNDGIAIFEGNSKNNILVGNTVSNNEFGICVQTHACMLFHNNLINNTFQTKVRPLSVHTWDDGYPSGGNYWSNYTGVDEKSGPNQDQPGSDGIGDTSYEIDVDNQDNYPLMGTFSEFNATSEHYVQTICNSTISDFQFNGTAISFSVTGEDGTVGFCRACIPTISIDAPYTVFVNGTEIPHTLLPCSNSTHSYLYFTYTHSTQEVVIIPEFPSTLIVLLIMALTLGVAVLSKKRLYVKNS